MTPYPAYKPSGVEWLGEIPSHWDVQRLKYMTGINTDTLPENTDPDFVLQYVDIGSVNSTGTILETQEMRFEDAPSRARRKTQQDDTIISTVRTYLKAIAFIESQPDNLIASTGFAVLRPHSELAPDYLWRWVQSQGFVDAVVANSEGIGYPAITSTRLGELPTLIPPLPEQRAIAAYLDRETARLDAAIAEARHLIDLLREQRAALIAHTVTHGLDPNIPLRDSCIEWLGEIPAHWEILPLKYVVKQIPDAIKTGPFGSQLLSSEMQSGEIKVYNQRNVIDADLVQGDNYVSQEKYEELRAFTTYPGDILVTTRGTIGRCVIVPDDAELGILHPCLMRIQPDQDQILAEYLILLIQDSFLVQTQLFEMSNATTIEVIYSGTMRQIRIPLSPIPEQRAIAAYLNRETARLDHAIAEAETLIAHLEEYRAALIAAAVTGKLDVRQA